MISLKIKAKQSKTNKNNIWEVYLSLNLKWSVKSDEKRLQFEISNRCQKDIKTDLCQIWYNIDIISISWIYLLKFNWNTCPRRLNYSLWGELNTETKYNNPSTKIKLVIYDISFMSVWYHNTFISFLISLRHHPDSWILHRQISIGLPF